MGAWIELTLNAKMWAERFIVPRWRRKDLAVDPGAVTELRPPRGDSSAPFGGEHPDLASPNRMWWRTGVQHLSIVHIRTYNEAVDERGSFPACGRTLIQGT